MISSPSDAVDPALHGLRFEYCGPFSESVIAATSESLRSLLARNGVDARTARRLFSSYVELTYNILHHAIPEAATGGISRPHGRLLVKEEQGRFRISATSRVTCENAVALAERLEQFRNMSREQLIFEYKLRLTNLQFDPASASANGAGMGLVTVARDALEPIEYSVDLGAQSDCLFSIHALH
jgi:hypothetical protein